MGRRRRTSYAIASIWLVLLAGCSSTNREADPLASAGAEAGAVAAQGSAATPDATGSGSSSGVSSSSGSVSAPGASSGPSVPGTGSLAPKPATGPPIKIGMHFTADLGGVLGAFGVVDSTDGPAEDVIRKTARWINANGGFGGRKVEIVEHAGDPLAGSFDAQDEEACVHFTQDDKVSFVVSGAAGTTPNLLECLKRAKIPLIWNLHIPIDAEVFSKNDTYLYQPFSMRTERQGFYIDWLMDEGWAKKGAKVGLVYVDYPLHRVYRDKVLAPRAKANGLTIAAEAVLPPPQGSSDAGALYAAMANAVLRFRQSGVTHVLFAPSGGAIPFIFLNEASNQDFEPRYGFNSLDIPAFIDLNAPEGQLDGALAAGWLVTSDTLPPQRPHLPAERLCLKITNNRSDIASRYCDGLFWLKALFDQGAKPTPTSLRATVSKLGTGYASPWTFKSDFRTGRPDGAAAARMLKWGGKCECFEYYGDLRGVR